MAALILCPLVAFISLLIMVDGTDEQWNEKISKPVAVMILITVQTWFFWWLVDEPIAGVAFIMYSTVILVVGAIAMRVVARESQRWFWLAVLTFIVASFLLVPISALLEKIPAWNGFDVAVTVEVDTPDGLKSASGICRLTGNMLGLINHGGGGKHSISMDDLPLDLGDGRSVTLALGEGRKRVSVPKKGMGIEFKRSLMNGDRRGMFIDAMKPTFIARNTDEVQPIEPSKFQEFFGPGYRFVAMSLRWPDE